MTVRRANSSDMAAVTALLEAANLPPAGLERCIDTCFVAVDEGGGIIAAAGLEPCGEVALVRSVVVREDLRRAGMGEQVMEPTLELARQMGLQALYLFTTRAPDFFARFGFVLKPHRLWPEAMRSCSQYWPAEERDPHNELMRAMALEPLA